MSKAPTIETLFAVWEHNLDNVRLINKHLRSTSRKDTSAQDLVAHLRSCAVALAVPQENAAEADTTLSKPKIDKSVLAISEPKRVRSKEHLRLVASRPCLVCGRTPAQAHHVRFAQPRGLGLKVSDEFTVPLCTIHHSENHKTGDERAWWAKTRNRPPLKIARQLGSDGTHEAEQTEHAKMLVREAITQTEAFTPELRDLRGFLGFAQAHSKGAHHDPLGGPTMPKTTYYHTLRHLIGPRDICCSHMPYYKRSAAKVDEVS